MDKRQKRNSKRKRLAAEKKKMKLKQAEQSLMKETDSFRDRVIATKKVGWGIFSAKDVIQNIASIIALLIAIGSFRHNSYLFIPAPNTESYQATVRVDTVLTASFVLFNNANTGMKLLSSNLALYFINVPTDHTADIPYGAKLHLGINERRHIQNEDKSTIKLAESFIPTVADVTDFNENKKYLIYEGELTYQNLYDHKLYIFKFLYAYSSLPEKKGNMVACRRVQEDRAIPYRER